MATIERLESATPVPRDGVEGYALAWRESPRSPQWLSAEDLGVLYDNLPPEYRVYIEAAKTAGAREP